MQSGRYEILLADEPASLAEHHHLRFRVYCLDKGYEDPAAFPDRMERDAYDDRSVHFIARDRITDETVAALRLVMPSDEGFPCEQLCGFDAVAITGTPRRQFAEISRVCLLKPEHLAPQLVGEPGAHASQLMRTSEIALGLYQAAYAYSIECGLTHWLGFTSPAMRRLLQSQSIRLDAIGSPREHRGERQAYLFHWMQGAQLFGVAKQLRDPYVSASALLTRAASVA